MYYGMEILLVSPHPQWKIRWTVPLILHANFGFLKLQLAARGAGSGKSRNLKSFCCVPSWTSGGEHIKMHISRKTIRLHLRWKQHGLLKCSQGGKHSFWLSGGGERAKPEEPPPPRSPSPPKVRFLLHRVCTFPQNKTRAKKWVSRISRRESEWWRRVCVCAQNLHIARMRPARIESHRKSLMPRRTIKAILSRTLVILIANRRRMLSAAVRIAHTHRTENQALSAGITSAWHVAFSGPAS